MLLGEQRMRLEIKRYVMTIHLTWSNGLEQPS